MRVEYGALVAAIANALAAEGVPEHVRAVEAEVMAEADLLGVPSHGVRMLPTLLKALHEGHVRPDAPLTVRRDMGAICLLDGDYGPGRYISVCAMQRAVERAQRFGIGMCGARQVPHWGRAHSYAYRAAQAGMIGICATNAVPNMVTGGARKPVLGNNPLGIGVPRGPGRDPMVLDMAMSQAAVGKISTYLREGRPAPDGWGLDTAGEPTNDPEAILASRLLLPAGEHKGAGLALMIEMLTGALCGGMLSHEVDLADPGAVDSESSKFFIAIDVAAFGEPEAFYSRVEDQLAFARQAVGSDGGYLYPGERGWQARERGLAEGIPIHPQIVEQLAAVGVQLAEAKRA